MHAGEDGLHGAGQRVHQRIVGLGAGRVDHHHPLLGQVIAHRAEEFDRGQVKGDVGRAVGVYGDHVVAPVDGLQVIAAVGGDRVQVGLIHIEPLASHRDDAGVDLHAVDGDVAIHRRVLPGGGPGRQPDQQQAVHPVGGVGRGVEVGRHQEIVPDAIGEHVIGVVDRVDAHPIVEAQPIVVAVLHHPDIVVLGLRLEDGVFVSPDGAGAPEQAQRQNDDHHPPIDQYQAG